jgi:hypothetical protein
MRVSLAPETQTNDPREERTVAFHRKAAEGP